MVWVGGRLRGLGLGLRVCIASIDGIRVAEYADGAPLLAVYDAGGGTPRYLYALRRPSCNDLERHCDVIVSVKGVYGCEGLRNRVRVYTVPEGVSVWDAAKRVARATAGDASGSCG